MLGRLAVGVIRHPPARYFTLQHFFYNGRAHRKRNGNMRIFTIVAMAIALLSATAYAAEKKSVTARSDEQLKLDADIDKAYQNALKSTRDKRQPAKIDPWQTVRPVGTGSAKQ
jgi:hypothetical protein